MIVKKESSILGYENEKSTDLDADHHTICKYSSRSSSNYQRVRSVLKTLVSAYLERGIGQKTSLNQLETRLISISGTQIQTTECLAAMRKVQSLLGVSNSPDEDLEALREHWARGTCAGTVSNETFKTWAYKSSSSSILWMHGRPGSGKSVTASRIANALIESGHRCHCYFFKYEDATKRSPNAMLRSLAYQAARDIPSYRGKLTKLAHDRVSFEKAESRRIWHELFELILFKLNTQVPLFWIIDAVDESESINSVISILSGIHRSTMPIRIVLTGRPMPLISTALDRIASRAPVASLCIDNNTDDIRAYVEKEMDFMHGSSHLRKAITDQLVQRSEGNFLWVRLAVREISESHSQDDVERALEEIPNGMESLYGRMETSIARLSRQSEKTMARMIMIWAMYARRPLEVEELHRVLKAEFPTILDLRRTVNQICGQFVVVDANDRVCLVHQTARDYLIHASKLPFSLAAREAEEELFAFSLSVFFDPHMRSRLSQKSFPPFCSYASTSWAYHLGRASASSDRIITLLVKFLTGPYVLSWIEALATSEQLKGLVFASTILNTFVQRRRKVDAGRSPLQHRLVDLETIELWAIDLLKLVGKFGISLLQEPTAIYKLIPQLCPTTSRLYQQFGKSSLALLSVSGLSSNKDWDDLLSRISIGTSYQALSVTCSARYIAVVTSAGAALLWDSLSFDEAWTFPHKEHIFKTCFSHSGDLLATYGLRTTKVWSTTDGHQVIDAPNPTNARALDLAFTDDDTALLMASDLRGLGKLLLRNSEERWHTVHPNMFQEECSIDGTFKNSPTSVNFSNDRSQLVVAYRGSPLEVWDLNSSTLVNRCKRRSQLGGRSNQARTGVNRVQWHPNSGEVLGIYTDGAVFKWHPNMETHHELPLDSKGSPSEVQCSPDGEVFATSDVNGTVQLYSYHDFALLYPLSSEDTVTALCFSPDSRRFYDIRGSFCNVWEPNALIRLSAAEDQGTEVDTEAGSMAVLSHVPSEARAESSIPITSLASRQGGSLVCSGTEDGTIMLHDIRDDTKSEIGTSAIGMIAEHIIWSDNGRYLAYEDLSRRLVVKSVEPLPGQKASFGWKIESLLDVKLNLGSGKVRQILFSADSDLVSAVGSNAVQFWSLSTKSLLSAHVSDRNEHLIWINHPAIADQMMACTNSDIEGFSWSGGCLKKLWKLKISDPTKPTPATSMECVALERSNLLQKSSSAGTANVSEDKEILEKILLSPTREHLLLFYKSPCRPTSNFSRVLIISAKSLGQSSETIAATPLPEAILAIMERPLKVLGKDRFVFIDKSFWICTWRLDLRATQSVTSGHEDSNRRPSLPAGLNGPRGVTRHFFLPRDWIDPNSLALCEVMDDGTLLCPRKGEIAAMRSGIGSEW